MIQNLSRNVMGLRVIPVDVYKFEVDEDDETYVVNLQTMKCT